MNKIELNDGNKIPQIGLGTWNVDSNQAKKIVLEAYKLGYCHFDTAQIYNNEYEIGLAIKTMPRNKIFITTKVWIPNYNNRDDFLKSIKQSLKRLEIKQIDLLLLHWPIKNKIINAYKWLEEAKDLGYTKSIGVSNFMINHLKQILKVAKYIPTVNQIEIQPLTQQKELVTFCKKNKINIVGYSNIRSYINGEVTDKEKDTLEKIAKEVNKTVPQVILRWVYQEGIIIIPKSSNIEHLKSNLKIIDFELSQNQIDKIRKLDRNNYTKADEIYEGNLWAKETLKQPNFLFENHF